MINVGSSVVSIASVGTIGSVTFYSDDYVGKISVSLVSISMVWGIVAKFNLSQTTYALIVEESFSLIAVISAYYSKF